MPTLEETGPLKERIQLQLKIRLEILGEWIKSKKIPWEAAEDGTYIRDLHGELIPIFTPGNIKEFCDWEWDETKKPPHPSLPRLRKISRGTLYQKWYDEERNSIDTALKNIKLCKELQLELNNKVSIIEALRATTAYLEKVVHNQEKETREARIALAQATQDERRRTRELRLALAEARRKISEVESKNMELTSILAKLTPLKIARTGRKP